MISDKTYLLFFLFAAAVGVWLAADTILWLDRFISPPRTAYYAVARLGWFMPILSTTIYLSKRKGWSNRERVRFRLLMLVSFLSYFAIFTRAFLLALVLH